MLIELARHAFGDDGPSHRDEAADLGRLALGKREHPRKNQNPDAALERALLDELGGEDARF